MLTHNVRALYYTFAEHQFPAAAKAADICAMYCCDIANTKQHALHNSNTKYSKTHRCSPNKAPLASDESRRCHPTPESPCVQLALKADSKRCHSRRASEKKAIFWWGLMKAGCSRTAAMVGLFVYTLCVPENGRRCYTMRVCLLRVRL